MLVVIDGGMGSGKSLVMAKLGKVYVNNGIPVFSNKMFGFETKLFSLSETYPPKCAILLDEAYQFYDSRPNETVNNFLSLFRMMYRKNVDWILSLHGLDTLDKRIRREVDFKLDCKSNGKKISISGTNMNDGSHWRTSLPIEEGLKLMDKKGREEETPKLKESSIKALQDALGLKKFKIEEETGDVAK
jgi:hypothetical protein